MGEEKKDGIIEAALKLFEEQGYHQTKVSDIVRAAGVAQGTFYLYFQSKEDLFRSIAKSCLEEISGTLKKGPVDGLNDNEVFYQMIKSCLTIYYHNKTILRIIYRNGVASQEIADISEAFYNDMMLIIKQCLLESGEYPDYSEQQLEITAYAKIGMVELVAYQWFVVRNCGPEHIDCIAQTITGMGNGCKTGLPGVNGA
ncbi:TetR/AcrR family transcriptional regulator [Paenibacillus rigui]|uniref:TetR family transcriptional regulator n=1 Tax=Paenibacillus rigui TaxID=554312 RepID=A0A229ULV4_9BACL|nr:TetR/AcrR family transcriptional regulator [Paenibacillus rigui]OXM84284.1 TetR family transcriptional regulator [Paenibacillus rigui]